MGAARYCVAVVSAAVVVTLAVSASASASTTRSPDSHGVTHSSSVPASAPGGTWGAAVPLTGVAAGNVSWPGISSVSCVSPGNCAAAGVDSGSGGYSPFVVQETDGTWGDSQALAGSVPADSPVAGIQISCGAPGSCAVIGYYTVHGSHAQGFIATETNDSWGPAQPLPGIADLGDASAASWPVALSCAAAGDCTVVGDYDNGGNSISVFADQETGGAWRPAVGVPGTIDPSVGPSGLVGSVSCGSAGNCSAVGSFTNSENASQGFVVNETDGTWGPAQAVPGLTALASVSSSTGTVSCTSAGNCSAGGMFEQTADGSSAWQAMVVDETDGVWGDAEEVPGISALNSGLYATLTALSCASPGNCAAAGTYQVQAGAEGYDVEPFVVTETSGLWGSVSQLPGIDSADTGLSVNAISCGSPGNCSAGGSYTTVGDTEQAYVASAVDGTWQSAEEVPGTAALNSDGYASVQSVSCTAAGYCSAAGYYQANSHIHAFTVDEASQSSLSLVLGPAKVAYGDEESLRASVTVSSDVAGTPTGTVTVTAAGTSLCSITLAAAAGMCSLPATELSAGRYALAAAYSGDSAFLATTSATMPLTVSRAASRIRFALSRSLVTYGHERAEKLSVVVTGQYAGVPAGTVDIKSGKATVCVLTLRSGRADCRLRPKQLRPSTFHLIAEYRGSSNYLARSAMKTIVVKR